MRLEQGQIWNKPGTARFLTIDDIHEGEALYREDRGVGVFYLPGYRRPVDEMSASLQRLGARLCVTCKWCDGDGGTVYDICGDPECDSGCGAWDDCVECDGTGWVHAEEDKP